MEGGRPVQLLQTPCLADGETEAQEEKGSWPREHSEFFPASSTEPSARAGGSCQVEGEAGRWSTVEHQTMQREAGFPTEPYSAEA